MKRFGTGISARAGLSVTAATILMLGLSAGPATAEPAPPTSGLSRSFEIQNLTQNAAFFAGLNGGDSLSGGPGVGSVLQPGQSASFSASSYVFTDGDVYPVYKAWPDNDPNVPHTGDGPRDVALMSVGAFVTHCAVGGLLLIAGRCYEQARHRGVLSFSLR